MAGFHTRFGAAVVAAAMLAGGPAFAAHQLKIGAVLPLTGELADYGPAAKNGIELAIEQINKAGGVNSAPVDLAVGDDQTSPQAGVDAAQKLVSVEHVDAILGPMGSGVFIPVAKTVTIPAGIPLISGSATSPVISTLDSKGFTFRTVPSDAFQGVALAQVTKDKGYTSVGVIYVNNDYGKGLADSFQKSFTKAGGKVTAVVPFEPKQASFRGEVQKAATGHPQALVLIAYTGDGVPILKEALESGRFSHFMLSDGMKAPEIVDAIGADYLNGSAGTAAAPLPGYAAAETFRADYKAKFGQVSPKPYIDTFYDATYVIALAAEKAHSSNGAKIRDAIKDVTAPDGVKVGPGEFAKAKAAIAQGKKIDYIGASGPVKFDAHGDVGGTFAHWEIQNGKIVTVKIFEPKQ
ncbi:leucine-, isoleucine-, valine-, threonine-, and alanine-binding protein precursor [mine drainage metagenome]|uniref:Leucine-, isoleucine-, valine-, threonine-, and alanine-binding protein n=1 Tax=mine drainage metagenome TaxID=410659 RepID=A0A1J5RW72_9ZZZZ